MVTIEKIFEELFWDQTPKSFLLAITKALDSDLFACAGFFFKYLSFHCVSVEGINAGVLALDVLQRWSVKKASDKVFQSFGFDFTRATCVPVQPYAVMCVVNAVGQILHQIPAKRARGEKGKARPFWEPNAHIADIANRHYEVAIWCKKLVEGKPLTPNEIHSMYKFFVSKLFPERAVFVPADCNNPYWTERATDDEKWLAGKYLSQDLARACEKIKRIAKYFLSEYSLQNKRLQGFALHAKENVSRKFKVPLDVLKTGNAVTRKGKKGI